MWKGSWAVAWQGSHSTDIVQQDQLSIFSRALHHTSVNETNGKPEYTERGLQKFHWEGGIENEKRLSVSLSCK